MFSQCPTPVFLLLVFIISEFTSGFPRRSFVCMERNNSLSKNLKDRRIGDGAIHGHLRNPWLCSSRSPLNHHGCSQTFGRSEDNYLCGIPWPPRTYSCSFCKREFRSAQALGGHMNVHRRDRARLRQSSPVEDFYEYPVLSLSSNPVLSPSPNLKANPIAASSTSPSLFTTDCSSTSRPTVPSLFSPASDCLNEVKAADQNLPGTLRSRTMESKLKPENEASARVQEIRERYTYSTDDVTMDRLSGSDNNYIDLELRLGCP